MALINSKHQISNEIHVLHLEIFLTLMLQGR